MRKFNRIVCVLMVFSFASMAHAKAIKIKEFNPVLNGVTENPDVDGMAIINHIAGTGYTELRITVTDLAPSTQFRAEIKAFGNIVTQPFETNAAGNGHVMTQNTYDITHDWEGNPVDIHIQIFIDVNNDFVVAPSEIRAMGCISGTCTLPLSVCNTDADCDDSYLCSNEVCDLGYCDRTAVQCDDGDACTADFCVPADGSCEYTPIYDPPVCDPF